MEEITEEEKRERERLTEYILPKLEKYGEITDEKHHGEVFYGNIFYEKTIIVTKSNWNLLERNLRKDERNGKLEPCRLVLLPYKEIEGGKIKVKVQLIEKKQKKQKTKEQKKSEESYIISSNIRGLLKDSEATYILDI